MNVRLRYTHRPIVREIRNETSIETLDGVGSPLPDMKHTFVAGCLFSLFLASPAAAATCPFNVPVVTLPPHTVSGYSWGNVIRPMNDPCIGEIEVDPTNALAWYAGGPNGLYMTKNGGATWTKPITGNLQALFLVADQPQLVYAGVGNKLYLTRDWGSTWTVIRTFPKAVYSVLVSGGTLYVGLAWDNHVDPSGIWMGNLGAGVMTFKPFGPGQTGLIVWTMAPIRSAARSTRAPRSSITRSRTIRRSSGRSPTARRGTTSPERCRGT